MITMFFTFLPTTLQLPIQKLSITLQGKPVFQLLQGKPVSVKGCGVATLSISYYDLGYQTGKMAYEILVNGADPSTMEVEFAPAVTKQYNPDICEKLGITVPDDYEALDMSE